MLAQHGQDTLPLSQPRDALPAVEGESADAAGATEHLSQCPFLTGAHSMLLSCFPNCLF